MKDITGKTKVLGIIGWPISHSLSPLMQNAAIAALGLDYIYAPFPVDPAALAAAVKGLKSLGVCGFNVTIPHKTAIMPFLDKLSPEAEAMGAVNTVTRDGAAFVGHNTDGIGFLQSIRDDLEFEPLGKNILVMGAGGAARSAVAALCGAGAARIVVANRSMDRGELLLGTFTAKCNKVEFSVSPLEGEEFNRHLEGADLLVNTTSVGMNGTAFPGLNLSLLKNGAKVYDMVYAPPLTPLLAQAQEQGLVCANGLGMLASQGEAAFKLWTDLEPPARLMKERLLSAIETG